MRTAILLAFMVLMAIVADMVEAGCAPNMTRDPSVRQTKKNKIRVGWGRKVSNKECLKEARVSYAECGGAGDGSFGMRVVPKKDKGNGASFIVEPNKCYNVWVVLVGTDGSQVHSNMLTIQMETEPNIEVVG